MSRRARTVVAAVIVGVAALPGAARADGPSDELEGTFQGTRHDVTTMAGGRNDDQRTLTNGKMKLARVGPGQWKGTASAHLKIAIHLAAQGTTMDTSGEGDVTGTVELQLRPGSSSYEVIWQLPGVITTMRVTVPNLTPTTASQRLEFEGAQTKFERNAELPKDGVDLDGVDDHGTPTSTRHMEWKLKGQGLVAVPRVAPVVRTQKAHLDGTASTPKDKLTRYQWTLEPIAGQCPQDPPSTPLDGAQVDVTMLCPMKATLVVWQGSTQSKPKTIDIAVTPRVLKKTDVKPASATPVDIPDSQLVSGGALFGELVCSVEERSDSPAAGHIIHRPSTATTWRDFAYTISAPINDPKSPFDHWVYIQDYKGRYAHRVRINRDLRAGSPSEVPGHARDLAFVRGCTVKHELAHDDRIRAYLATKAGDPSVAVEALVAHGQDDVTPDFRLEALANSAIADIESAIAGQNFFEAQVHADLEKSCRGAATIMLKLGDSYQSRTYDDVANIGDIDQTK